MKRQVQGSFTIEAAVIVPLILTVFATILMLLFYYHDKNVITAIVHETLVMESKKEEITVPETEQYLQSRIKNKLLLFGSVHSEIEIQGDELTISCSAKKQKMIINIKQNMKRTNPEQLIWKLRRMNQITKEAEIEHLYKE